MPAELDAVLSAYEVGELLGRGGMGAVYRAVQPNLERNVAIKILPLELAAGGNGLHFSQRFKQEAKSMAKLSHPGIVQVHDFGQAEADGGDFLYFVMEFVEGRNILQYLREQGGKLDPEHAHAIVCHVLDAIGFAHQHGVIHRDIKPANILLDQYGRVKVADFGLAKSAGQETDLTASNMAMGTPDFIAPEALESGKEVDRRADLYSVGAMLYQLLTGRVPRGVFQPATELVPGLDVRYDAIVMRALRPDPDARYQEAAEFRADLDRIVTEPTPVMKLGIGTIPLVRPGANRVDSEAETTPMPVSDAASATAPDAMPDAAPDPVPRAAAEARPHVLKVRGLGEDKPKRKSGIGTWIKLGGAVGLALVVWYFVFPGESAQSVRRESPRSEADGGAGPEHGTSEPLVAIASGPGGSDAAAFPGPRSRPVGQGAELNENGSANWMSKQAGQHLEGIPGLREILADLMADRRRQIDQLAVQYGRALEKELDQAADSGDLRSVSAYRDERSGLVTLMRSMASETRDDQMIVAFGSAEQLPPLPRNSSRELVKVRGIWDSEIEKIDGEFRSSIRRVLTALERKLVAAGEQDKVRKLAAIRERLAGGGAAAREAR